MTASDILSAWRRVAPAFRNHPIKWLKLLAVAEAGADGITLQRLIGDGDTVARRASYWATMQAAEQAGIITIKPGPPNPMAPNGARRSALLTITPAGMRLLGLTAPRHETPQ